MLRRPQMLGYWCCYLWFNYVALVRGLLRTDPHGLTGNSRSLALTRTLPMGLGFVTWAAAARAFPASDVGLAAAAFSAATLVSHLATSGPGNALVLLAPSRPGSARRLTRAASGVVVVTSLAAGVLLAVLAGRFAPSLAGLVDHPAGWLAFLALVVAISWAYLYDHVAIAVRRSADALRRSVVQAGLLLVVVLVLLPAAPDPAWAVLVGAGAAGGLASVLLGMAQARRRLPAPSTSGARRRAAVAADHRHPQPGAHPGAARADAGAAVRGHRGALAGGQRGLVRRVDARARDLVRAQLGGVEPAGAARR